MRLPFPVSGCGMGFFIIDAVYYEFKVEAVVEGVYTMASTTVAPIPNPRSNNKFGCREQRNDERKA